MTPLGMLISGYIVIGTLIAMLLVWVHYSPEADDCTDPEFHALVRQNVVIVVLITVMLWFPFVCQVLILKATKKRG